MLRAIFRIVFGYALACMAAGLVMVLHVISPAELVSAAVDGLPERLGELGTLAGLSATHIAVFSLPFALIVAAVAEWFALRGWLYFLLGGLAIAGTGFLAQQAGETAAGPSIVNAFAGQAFLLTGIAGGLVYWLVSGRRSGGDADPGWETFSDEPPPPRVRPEPRPSAQAEISIERTPEPAAPADAVPAATTSIESPPEPAPVQPVPVPTAQPAGPASLQPTPLKPATPKPAVQPSAAQKPLPLRSVPKVPTGKA